MNGTNNDDSRPAIDKRFDRFFMAPVASGALLLDTVSGAVFELNEPAAFIWRLRLNSVPAADIVLSFKAKYDLSLERANKDVLAALSPFTIESAPAPTEFRYETTGAGYDFFYNGSQVLHATADGARLRPVPGTGAPEWLLPSLVRAIAPKLLALRGHVVLHASAVSMNGSATAFSGVSGAGKTTTARAWADVGASLLCEDQLLLRIASDVVLVGAGAERIIGAWVASAASHLAAGEDVSCRGLDEVTNTEFIPLRELGFIDASQQRTSEYHVAALAPWRSAGLAFRNAFYGADGSAEWLSRLQFAASIGTLVTGFQVRLPEGLNALRESARHAYARRSLRS